MKVYIESEGIGALEDRINCDFFLEGFDLLIQDSEKAHRRLKVDELAHQIVPEKSKIMVKPNKIVVSMQKEVNSKWYHLTKK